MHQFKAYCYSIDMREEENPFTYTHTENRNEPPSRRKHNYLAWGNRLRIQLLTKVQKLYFPNWVAVIWLNVIQIYALVLRLSQLILSKLGLCVCRGLTTFILRASVYEVLFHRLINSKSKIYVEITMKHYILTDVTCERVSHPLHSLKLHASAEWIKISIKEIRAKRKKQLQETFVFISGEMFPGDLSSFYVCMQRSVCHFK